MNKLSEYQVFTLTEKLGMLVPNIDWVIYENPKMEWKKPSYKVMLHDCDEHKAIGVIHVELLDKAIDDGICIVKGMKKFKRKVDKPIDKSKK